MAKRSEMWKHWLIMGHEQVNVHDPYSPEKPKYVKCSCGKMWAL